MKLKMKLGEFKLIQNWGDKMSDMKIKGADGTAIPFPKIMNDVVDRLSKEANERMLERKFPVSVKLKGKPRWLVFIYGFKHHNKNNPIRSLRPSS